MRRLLVGLSVLVLMYAAMPLFASIEAREGEICCADMSECPTGYRCRVPDGIPCSPEAIGSCVPIIVNGEASE